MKYASIRKKPKFIQAAGLTTYCGQKAYFEKGNRNVNFPIGSYEKDKVGSLEMKTAWRVLVPGVDNFAKYFTRLAVIEVPASYVAGKVHPGHRHGGAGRYAHHSQSKHTRLGVNMRIVRTSATVPIAPTASARPTPVSGRFSIPDAPIAPSTRPLPPAIPIFCGRPNSRPAIPNTPGATHRQDTMVPRQPASIPWKNPPRPFRHNGRATEGNRIQNFPANEQVNG